MLVGVNRGHGAALKPGAFGGIPAVPNTSNFHRGGVGAGKPGGDCIPAAPVRLTESVRRDDAGLGVVPRVSVGKAGARLLSARVEGRELSSSFYAPGLSVR